MHTNPTPIDYINAGFCLVPFAKGTKGPGGVNASGWNKQENCISTVEQAKQLNGSNIGLAHAYSGTCAIDIDNFQMAEEWLDKKGIDLIALTMDPQNAQIESGRENHAKLIFKMPEQQAPLPQKKVKETGEDIIDFRCGTSDGLTVQDVLPPSIHPDTEEPYQWKGDYRNLSEIPPQLLEVWKELIGDQHQVNEKIQPPSLWERAQLEGLGLTDQAKALIENGDTKGVYESRSEAIFGAMKDLIKAGVDDDTICRIMADPENGISEQTIERCRGDIAGGMKRIANQIPKAKRDVEKDKRKRKQSVTALETVSWSALSSKHFDPVKWVINEILPPGVSLLIGRPKQGKSWLVHSIALLAAAGRDIFGEPTSATHVLYMALEDSERRLQNRTKKIMWSHNLTDADIGDRFACVIEALRLGEGLEQQITDYVKAYPDTRLVVIDVLAKVRGDRKPSQSLFKYDYEVGEQLKAICKGFPQLAIIVVHHANKGIGDALDSVSGTNGLAAGVDNVYSLVGGPEGPEIHINARDVENSSSIPLESDGAGMWTMASREDAGLRALSETRTKILEAIKAGNETPKDIAETTGILSNNVKQHLLRMAGKQVVKAERGRYIIKPPFPFEVSSSLPP